MSIAELYKNRDSRDITCILLFLSYLILEGEENQNSHLRYQNNGALLNISSESQLSFVFFVFFCLSRNYRARNCRYLDILHKKCLNARYLSSAKESILKKNPISIEIHTHCTKACTLAKNEEAKLYM